MKKKFKFSRSDYVIRTQSCGNSTVSKRAFTPAGFSTSTRFISQSSQILIPGNIQIHTEFLFSARPTKYNIKQQHAATLKESNISIITGEILDKLITGKAIDLSINVWSDIKKEKTWHKQENAINSRFSRGKLHTEPPFSNERKKDDAEHLLKGSKQKHKRPVH